MKVHAAYVWAPPHWPIEPGANGSRQVRAVCAAPSKRAFCDALNEVGVYVGLSALNASYAVTGNAAEVAVATSNPGAVFHATDTNHAREYVEAKPKGIAPCPPSVR